MYPRPGTGGKYQELLGCPMGSQGNMEQWDVLKSQCTFYGKAGQLRKLSLRIATKQNLVDLSTFAKNGRESILPLPPTFQFFLKTALLML